MLRLKKTPGLLKKDDSAAEGLPLRIVATLILFSVILGLSIKFFNDFTSDVKEKKLKGDLDLLEKRASVMYTYGGGRDANNLNDFPGSVENIHITVPDNVAYVVIGAIPSPDGKPPLFNDIHTDNVYFYITNDGRTETRSSIARFSVNGTRFNRPLVLYPGEYQLELELVKNGNGTYIQFG
jgi:hypothetical protein